jgi:hypothetical protein
MEASALPNSKADWLLRELSSIPVPVRTNLKCHLITLASPDPAGIEYNIFKAFLLSSCYIILFSWILVGYQLT